MKKKSYLFVLLAVILISMIGLYSNTNASPQPQETSQPQEMEIEESFQQEEVDTTPIEEEPNRINDMEQILTQTPEFYQFDVVWSEYTKTSKSYHLVDYENKHLVFVTSGRVKGKKKTSYHIYDIVGDLETELHRIDPETGEPYARYYKYAYSGNRQYIVECAADGSFSWAFDAHLIHNSDYDMEEAKQLLMTTDYYSVMSTAYLETKD